MTGRKIDILITAWGEEYVTSFLQVTLPSMLAVGNLPVLSEKAEIRLQIFTSSEDQPVIARHPAIHKAGNYASVNFNVLGSQADFAGMSAYLAQNTTIQAAVNDAARVGSDLMILAPDFVIADGSLSNLHDRLDGMAHGMALLPSIRTNKFAFLADLLAQHGWEPAHAHSLTLSSRELASIAFAHLHPLVHAAFVTRPEDGKIRCRPPLFFAPVDESSLMVRGMVWSPIYIRPRIYPDEVLPTIDFQDFPTACGIDRTELVAIDDSDDVLILEYSNLRADFYQVDRQHATTDSVIDWIGRMGMPHHLDNLAYSYLFHANDVSDAARQETAVLMDEITTDVESRMNTLIAHGLVSSLTASASKGEHQPRNLPLPGIDSLGLNTRAKIPTPSD